MKKLASALLLVCASAHASDDGLAHANYAQLQAQALVASATTWGQDYLRALYGNPVLKQASDLLQRCAKLAPTPHEEFDVVGVVKEDQRLAYAHVQPETPVTVCFRDGLAQIDFPSAGAHAPLAVSLHYEASLWMPLSPFLPPGAIPRPPAPPSAPASLPERINAPPVQYPLQALAANEGGTAIVLVGVNAAGGVDFVRLQTSSGRADIDASAMDHARRTLFKPAMANLKPIARTVRIPYNFSFDAWPADKAAMVADYVHAVGDEIARHWTPPSPASAGSHCVLGISQQADGTITDAEPLDTCELDDNARASLVQAVKSMGALPTVGYDKVFRPWFVFDVVTK
ncbi:energy transducer TonB [Dyella soli]|uniref:Energy transducer TonB n=1 Tax=Dyella soli TaxID=522319 RepID=A0A4R0YQP9_9GAMM|nr:energy transducer TonB [Dyella soli]TCI11297.1 energy transducer TonB [Dyella soli]